MKRNKIIQSLLLGMLLASCSDSADFGVNEWQPSLDAHYINVSTTSVSLSAAEVTNHPINVEAVQTPWQISGQASWLKISPVSGSGDATVHLSASANLSGDTVRTTVFDLASTDPDYKYSKQISVTQSASTPYINVSEDNIAFTSAASSKTITVSSNVRLSINVSANWLKATLNQNTLTITAEANATGASRTPATVKLVGTNCTHVINVSQSAPTIITDEETMQFGNEGGSTEVAIKADAEWTAVPSVSWLTATPSQGAAGDNKVVISAAPNNSTSSRSGNVDLKIGSKTVSTYTVQQEGLILSLSPSSLNFTAAKSSQNVAVTSNTEWSVLEKPEWVTLSASSGKGSQTISVTAEDNWTTSSRSGTITLGRAGTTLRSTISVSQAERKFDNITTRLTYNIDGGQQTVAIDTDGKWTAEVSDASWISVSPVSGTGEGTLTVTVKENTGTDSREGVVSVTVGSIVRNIIIEQEGKYFTATLDNSTAIPSKGGTHSVSIKTNDSWTAKKQADWITLSKTSGKGDINVTLTASDNPSINTRTDTTTFTPSSTKPVRIVTVQAARYLRVDTEVLSIYSRGGTTPAVTVETDGTYTVTSSVSWAKVNRSGDTFTVTVDALPGDQPREGNIVVAMTELRAGEEYKINIPLRQSVGTTFNFTQYPADEDWNVSGNTSFGVTVTGFGTDSNWNF